MAGNQDTIPTDTAGRPLQGFDPVAYFMRERVTRGDSEFVDEWAGQKWLFVRLAVFRPFLHLVQL